MAASKTKFYCNDCGNETSKWVGQCPACLAWNTLIESPLVKKLKPAAPNRFANQLVEASAVCSLDKVKLNQIARQEIGLTELDRVLGGGVVTGSVTLLGGDPGIGKSTLLLQMLACLTAAKLSGLYITGEESAQQISLRARRLNISLASIRVLTENNLEHILQVINEQQAKVLIIDSIQTVYSHSLQSAPGSVAQVRECAAQLVQFIKQTESALFLVGHVTKEGAIAGPRVLEHMVDTVLYFEGDSGSRYRIVRAVKNRYGAVNELGIFAMTDKGLREVANPSAIFLSRQETDISGSAILVTQEGSRPLLVEVQALVDSSHLANPRRVALGLEQNRLAMLLAVIQRHINMAMNNQDVFINITGGIRINETAVDLPLLAAIISSYQDKPLPPDLILFGEIGLSGEVRPVYNGLARLNEAVKHGFKSALIPIANNSKQVPKSLKVQTISHVSQLVEKIFA